MISPREQDYYLTNVAKFVIMDYCPDSNKIKFSIYGMHDNPQYVSCNNLTHLKDSRGTVWFKRGSKINFRVSFKDRNGKEHSEETAALSVSDAINHFLFVQGSRLYPGYLPSVLTRKIRVHIEELTGKTYTPNLLSVVSINLKG